MFVPVIGRFRISGGWLWKLGAICRRVSRFDISRASRRSSSICSSCSTLPTTGVATAVAMGAGAATAVGMEGLGGTCAIVGLRFTDCLLLFISPPRKSSELLALLIPVLPPEIQPGIFVRNAACVGSAECTGVAKGYPGETPSLLSLDTAAASAA